jgi:predicted O-methyltransferase YrrM
MPDSARPQWAMNGFMDPAVDEYLYSLLPQSEPVLREMEQVATERRIPIVGPLVGRYLFQLARMIGARCVFEMGSAIGYSTIWWAMAMGEAGRVIYTDGDRKNAAEAAGYFQRAGVTGRVDIRTGDAIELLSEERGEFDIILIDIDKEDYVRALRMAAPRIRQGGLLVADNVLWDGKVADPAMANDASTRGILEFNRALYANKDFWTTINPLRDGVAVAMKI